MNYSADVHIIKLKPVKGHTKRHIKRQSVRYLKCPNWMLTGNVFYNPFCIGLKQKLHALAVKEKRHFTQSLTVYKNVWLFGKRYRVHNTAVFAFIWWGMILQATNPVSALVCRSVSPLSPLPDSSWDSWAPWAGLGADSSWVAEAGLLVSMGDPSSCDTLTTAGSEVSTMSGLREAEGENSEVRLGNGVNQCIAAKFLG